jgi:hypothetical protein
MSALPKLDPNIEGILRDIAKDPNSLLFGSAHASSIRSPFSVAKRQIGIATPGLSSAEAELLRMHRREMGLVLLQAFDMSFFRDERASKAFSLDQELPRADAWEERARFSRDFAPSNLFKPKLSNLVSRLLDGANLSDRDRHSLVRMSLDLDYTPVAKQRYAIACMDLDMPQAAAIALAQVAESELGAVSRDSRSLLRVSLYHANRNELGMDAALQASQDYLKADSWEAAANELAFVAVQSVLDGQFASLRSWKLRGALPAERLAPHAFDHIQLIAPTQNHATLLQQTLECWES